MRARSSTLLLLMTGPVLAQSPRKAPDADAIYREPFGRLTSIRELADGRVIVSDAVDEALVLIDFASQTQKPIGRKGSGPGEWGRPGRLLAIPGDSTVMLDPLNQRLLLLGPSGQIVRTVSQESFLRGTKRSLPLGAFNDLLSARASDASGNFYAQGARYADRSGQLPDTVPILRISYAALVVDTVGFVRVVPRAGTGSLAQGAQGASGLIAQRPFLALDDWTARADGAVVIAHAEPYSISIVEKARRTDGSPVPHRQFPVSAVDKDEWIAQAKRRAARATVVINGVQQAPPSPSIPSEWPKLKPPFQAGIVAGTAGQLWVTLNGAAEAAETTLDVFDDRARLKARLTTEGANRVVGVGKRGLYLARRNDDGLEVLTRYPRP